MNILLVSKRRGYSASVQLGRRGVVVMLGLLLGLPLTGLYFGYQAGAAHGTTDVISTAWLSETEQQREAITEAKRVAEENLNALTLRLGQMQAHVIRLDALGQRLTRMAGLEDGEFDFSQSPAQGGPESAGTDQSLIAVPDFVTQLDGLTRQLENRNRQLGILETLLMNRNLHAEVFPAGRPILSGWISSHYGTRNDPFTGKPDFHKGVDLAGKNGAEVVAVAAGVVTYSGRRFGYGNLVEINHGGGYVTRYGHNKENVVQVGETIKKGQVIAHMGSTGRSTGPHVHFEVWRNGRTVDPMTYIQASAR